uniref:F-box domain-containing protein n=1 Tax=Moniliophthora roreri TaxID=221103 RepID=A0A0W0FJ10_MONRR
MKVTQDVVDLLIDEFSCNEDALKTLSLVSRSWVPRARRHLFRTLCLPQFPQSRTGRDPAAGPMYNTQDFISLCCNPHSTILYAGPTRVTLAETETCVVEHFCDIIGGRESAFISMLSWLRARREEEQEVAGTYAHKLFWNVRYLTLSTIGSKQSVEELKKLLLLSPFSHVTQLTIDLPAFRSQKSFSEILSSFTSLKKLLIRPPFDMMTPMIDHSITDITFPLSLTEVHAPHTSFLPIVESCSTLEHLTIFVAYPVVQPQFNAINHFLRSSAAVNNKRLKHCTLVLDPNNRYIPADINGLATLVHFDRIESWTVDTDWQAFLHGGFVPIPNVTTIVIRRWRMIRDVKTTMFDELIWGKMIANLDGILSECFLFPGLKNGGIIIHKPFDRELLRRSGWDEVKGTVLQQSEAEHAMNEVLKEVQKILRKCNAKGLLKTHYVDDSMDFVALRRLF